MTTYERIRQIFLHPSTNYSLSEAANLLEYSCKQIVESIDVGDLAVNEDSGRTAQLPWQEVALAAVERWPQDLIETALGPETEVVVPVFVRLTQLSIRVPRFNVVVLGRVAQREGTTIDHIVSRQLLDLAVNEAETLDRSVTGFSAAMRWPAL